MSRVWKHLNPFLTQRLKAASREYGKKEVTSLYSSNGSVFPYSPSHFLASPPQPWVPCAQQPPRGSLTSPPSAKSTPKPRQGWKERPFHMKCKGPKCSDRKGNLQSIWRPQSQTQTRGATLLRAALYNSNSATSLAEKTSLRSRISEMQSPESCLSCLLRAHFTLCLWGIILSKCKSQEFFFP